VLRFYPSEPRLDQGDGTPEFELMPAPTDLAICRRGSTTLRIQCPKPHTQKLDSITRG
jgi:hypothetical protein